MLIVQFSPNVIILHMKDVEVDDELTVSISAWHSAHSLAGKGHNYIFIIIEAFCEFSPRSSKKYKLADMDERMKERPFYRARHSRGLSFSFSFSFNYKYCDVNDVDFTFIRLLKNTVKRSD